MRGSLACIIDALDGCSRAGRHAAGHRGRIHPLERFPETAVSGVRKRKFAASRDHEAAARESLRGDREFAAAYLDAVLQDGDQDEFLLALRRLSDACGGVTTVAARADLNPTTLYRTLSANGNPELKSMRSLLRALGLRLSVEPIR